MGGIAPNLTTYPDYLQSIHSALLTGTAFGTDTIDPSAYGNVADFFLAAQSGVGGSPYATIEAYDPADEIDANQEQYDAWYTALGELDPEVDVAAHIAAATTAAGTLVQSSEIDAVVDAFEARSKGAYLREVSRFASGMFDVGAVLTTQFGMGMALMERDRADQLNDVDARLRLMSERERYQSATQVAMEMSRLQLFKLDGQRASVGGLFDLNKFKVAALQDQKGLDLGYEVHDATWDLELAGYPLQHIGALSGAVALQRHQTAGERLSAGILQSGSFGIQVGSALGNPAAGFLAGGVSLAAQLLAGIS